MPLRLTAIEGNRFFPGTKSREILGEKKNNSYNACWYHLCRNFPLTLYNAFLCKTDWYDLPEVAFISKVTALESYRLFIQNLTHDNNKVMRQ